MELLQLHYFRTVAQLFIQSSSSFQAIFNRSPLPYKQKELVCI
ncbi:hypothetical protein SAMN04488601_1011469 [Paenibacillus sp. 453mf]|nr:hypothetical protein SAMN04488601_1011469 [Paenibacillus sp. 453mf]